MEEVGWRIDAGFLDELVVGHDSIVSLLVYPWAWENDDPAFEISHEAKDTTYWVREIPTPQRATELIEEHGGPPDEERGSRRGSSEAGQKERPS